jgi:hypothetical protein
MGDFGQPQSYNWGFSGQQQQQPFGQAPNYNWGFPGQQPYNPAEYTDFSDEPPLHEELGLNFGHIKKKTIAVMNPFTRTLDAELLDDCDLAGPLVFGAMLGFALTLVCLSSTSTFPQSHC